MSVIARHLLPDTSRVDAGRLSIGGCDVHDLTQQFGTPLFVYDETHLRTRCREAVAAFGADAVVYATKAFLCTAMARLAHEEGLLLDVATGGELFVALHAGVPADRCVMHGNNKSTAELREAITAGVRHIVVDSFDELDRIDALHEQGLAAPRVQLRITPGVYVHTHEFVSTGQNDSKFGFNLVNGDAQRAVTRARAAKSVQLVGVHCHIGSNVFDTDNFTKAAEVMVRFANECELPELTLGGGLGVAYLNNENAPSITQWASALRAATTQLRSGVRVMVEPGRSIVASAAVTLYEVGTIKNIPGVRTYVAVDGGMSDNPRPVLYGSGYEAFVPTRTDADRTMEARIVGKHCESGDVLIAQASLPADLRVGDVIATPVTGAYGHSMGSNYNKVPRPAVVFVHEGKARVVVRRETYDDLVRNDATDSV
ncbi:MAG: diaminopimelate decarboxylase [Ilumatobacteraceae bacterium]|nr:diaminopimelate decarboxylase [Acidimicrobiia bacterium]NCX32016.1 diaminopimelate decarboxylase [Actinomycetota bacterium]NDC12178.1 diaminopimelate decarboxylase [Actinomycetota bacterium]NDE52107.1 diaminopimelate decarboxylase [Actinomycetota bacterium]NDF23170.1 diaminopimelate decarboxylase [Actinomycetota bacterium]